MCPLTGDVLLTRERRPSVSTLHALSGPILVLDYMVLIVSGAATSRQPGWFVYLLEFVTLLESTQSKSSCIRLLVVRGTQQKATTVLLDAC